MKKLILTFFLSTSLTATSFAPVDDVLLIPVSPSIVYNSDSNYNHLIDAIFKVESSSNPLAYNLEENAVGGLQIRQVRLDHYNKLNETDYKLENCYDYELSKKIFIYFTKHDSNGRPIPNKSWERAAKDWNGSGPMTETYWEKVKKHI